MPDPSSSSRATAARDAFVQRVSSSRAFAAIAPRVLPHLDRAVHQLSNGKVMISQYMLPSLFLTTTGRRSGAPRVTPLACLPEPETGTILVVGSNFGRPRHPAWTGNLLAEPEARAEHRGRTFPVRARLLEGDQREEAWQKLLRMWPPYATYQKRVDRQLRIFRLTPSDGAEAAGASEGVGAGEAAGEAGQD
ncbi:nitroreductase family deazaflavin-dependent oxidoreductase [Phaeacidiphilus oryzae]|uniref:nitroreductase family deazaflavin-dependent oxidoreductase n=1 Tax=Phaeacidiphilus oryzae TaxID=348818 RepID=UPI00069044A7|nr:nitroreductase family deazaflavin-dependent oxidoreductase [Phaeacidiphilus oryzae]